MYCVNFVDMLLGRKAVKILAGCPDGATTDALALHGITQNALDALLENDRIYGRIERMGNPAGMKRTKYHIKKGN